MALKNLFDMVKADRYTADGREAIIKAQEEETEDKVYQIGEISQKTGLQKTANGWVKPKSGKQPGAKNAETNYGKVEKKDGKWGVQQKLGKGSQFIEHKDKKDATEALKNYTEGYNTTARSKQDPHSDEARQVKQWNKETEKIRKENRAERRAEHAAQFQKQESKPTLSHKDHVSLAKEVLSNTSATDPGWTAEEIAKEWKLGKADAEEVKKEFDNLRKGSSGNKPAVENKTTIRQGPKTKTLNETPAEHVQKNLDAYKGYQPYDMEELVLKPSGYEKQTSARVPGGGQSITYKKEGAEDITLFFDKNGELENADVASTGDSAPRVLTGDTRIRVRKA